MPDKNNLVWIDMEMTGLNPDTDLVLEIATLVTDSELNVLAEGPCLAIHQPPERFDLMDEWCREHHTKSGLWKRVQESRLTCAEAERQTLEFLRQHVPAKASPLCGNSVWQDRRFLARHMPSLEGFLHYRLIDVSTVKELARRWYGPSAEFKDKTKAHLALSDIKESLAELKHYRKNVFLPIP